MTEQTQDARGETPSRSDEHIRQQAAVDQGQTLGIDNTDTALSPEDTGYTPEQDPDEAVAGKGSDPPLSELP